MNPSSPVIQRIVCLFVPVVALTAGSDWQTQAQDQVSADRAAMVIMAPNGPVIADMHISVNREPYRLWVATFLALRLDLDRDARLTESELDLMSSEMRDRLKIQSARQMLTEAAGKKEADAVQRDEFSVWLSGRLSRSFDVIAEAVRASDAVRLASLIDGDGDTKVTEAEVLGSLRTLRFRDLDDDQTFSVAELMPFRDPRNQQAAVVPEVANLPFIQLTGAEAVQRTVPQLMKRYGDETSIPTSVFRLPKDLIRRFDVNSDERFDSDECTAFLSDPVFHVRLDVLLSDRPNASQLQLTPSEFAQTLCVVTQDRRDRANVMIDDMPVEIRARGGSAQNRSFLINFLLQRVSLSDADKNGYLDESEFAALGGAMSQAQVSGDFQSVDLNGDQMVYRDELKAYIERDAIAAQSKIEVSVRQDGETLFKILDTNLDRRLTAREFKEGFQRLLEHDLNADRQIAESELGTKYVLQIGLGEPPGARRSASSMNMAMQSQDAVLPGIAGLDGPEWFRRMDRNQDGDVSFREFLGTRKMFQQLDADSDELLSAVEAAAASESTPPAVGK